VTVAARRTGLLVSVNLLGAAAFLWPFLLPVALGESGAHETDAPFVIVALVGLLGIVLAAELGRGGMGPKSVALIGVLGAAMVALRLPGFVGGFSAMFVIVLVAGNAFGPAFGFMLGAIGTFASGLFVGGLGPWLPFQMVAVGWVGLGAGLVPRSGRWPLRIGLLAAYGFAAALAFGAVMNLWFWPFAARGSAIGWVPGAAVIDNLEHYAAFYALTSFGWDMFGAVGNAIAVTVAGRPLIGALDRAARRMHFSTAGGRIIEGREPAGRPRRDPLRVEESPDSEGQDAGENPRRGDPRKAQQRGDRPGDRVRVKR
jgi:energy-coupling factor transport system substrate-specific component